MPISWGVHEETCVRIQNDHVMQRQSEEVSRPRPASLSWWCSFRNWCIPIDPRPDRLSGYVLENARRNIYDFLNNREEEAGSFAVRWIDDFSRRKWKAPRHPFRTFLSS